jgi:hypothetical protein
MTAWQARTSALVAGVVVWSPQADMNKWQNSFPVLLLLCRKLRHTCL